MVDRVCVVGLDEPEYKQLRERVDVPLIAYDVVPLMIVQDGQLRIKHPHRYEMLPIGKVVFHGIFEDDFDFITGLALWGGPCLPNAQAMLNARLKLPCLARALQYTRFGAPPRGYTAPGATIQVATQHVAKWGNWHCGENKQRFTETWTSDQASVIEPFLNGQSVRIMIIGDRYWQIRLEGDDWLKSLHDSRADLMDVDPELLDDTRRVQKGFGLEMIANDYIVADDGTKHLLEVNHIPDVTRFPEIWEAYRDYVINWLGVSQG